MSAPPIKFATRVSQSPADPPVVVTKEDIYTAAVAGQQRFMLRVRKTLSLPVGERITLSDANGAKGPRYVRVRSLPGGAPQQTFFSGDTEPSAANSDPLTLVGNDFIEQVLLPNEALYAVNNGVVAYNVIVYEVQF